MESVTILWIAFYVFIGLLSVQLVRFAGPLAIGGDRVENVGVRVTP